jgi:gallate decarboxylase subunit D
MIKTLEFSVGEGDYRVAAWAAMCGADVVLVVVGGTRPHVGSVAVAISHSSLKDPARLTASASVIAVPGHKEDQIAREAALKLSRALRTTVAVSAGLHVDDATPQEIERLVNNFNQLVDQVAAELAGIVPRE